MSRIRVLVNIFSALIVIAVIFQLFFRYQYITVGQGAAWRVDRLTNTICLMPCASSNPFNNIDFEPLPRPSK